MKKRSGKPFWLSAAVLACAICIFSISGLFRAEAVTIVSKSKFEPLIYEELLEKWDIDDDGKLSQDELDAVEYLDLSGLELDIAKGV